MNRKEKWIKEIFKIEEFSPHRLEQGGEKLRHVYHFKELRKNNEIQNKPLNSGLPLYPEEEEFTEKFFLEGHSLGETMDFFQRPQVSIEKIIDSLPMKYPKDFFQIENIRSVFVWGRFLGRLNDLLIIRKNNRDSNKLLNSGFPHYPEEKKHAIKMFREGRSMGYLVDYFQRHEKTLRKFLDLDSNQKEVPHLQGRFPPSQKEPKFNKGVYKKKNTKLLDMEVDITRLTDREFFVLKARWGLGLNKPLTLQEIGNLMGITRERVRQIEKKCLRKISFKEK